MGAVSDCAARMAALRKCECWMRAGRGVLGSGWEVVVRKGGGTSRSVSWGVSLCSVSKVRGETYWVVDFGAEEVGEVFLGG